MRRTFIAGCVSRLAGLLHRPGLLRRGARDAGAGGSGPMRSDHSTGHSCQARALPPPGLSCCNAPRCAVSSTKRKEEPAPTKPAAAACCPQTAICSDARKASKPTAPFGRRTWQPLPMDESANARSLLHKEACPHRLRAWRRAVARPRGLWQAGRQLSQQWRPTHTATPTPSCPTRHATSHCCRVTSPPCPAIGLPPACPLPTASTARRLETNDSRCCMKRPPGCPSPRALLLLLPPTPAQELQPPQPAARRWMTCIISSVTSREPHHQHHRRTAVLRCAVLQTSAHTAPAPSCTSRAAPS